MREIGNGSGSEIQVTFGEIQRIEFGYFNEHVLELFFHLSNSVRNVKPNRVVQSIKVWRKGYV